MRKLRPLAIGTLVVALGLVGALPGFEPKRAEASVLRALWERVTGVFRRSPTRPAQSVPELDPGVAGQALLLLGGGSVLLLDRRRGPRGRSRS